jgi:hypothetical protein
MPVFTFSSVREIGFTRFANFRVQYTAVSMVVQNMFVRANFTTWRSFETYRELPTTFVSIDTGDFIGNLNRFKPHGVVSRSFLVFCENLLIHRGK